MNLPGYEILDVLGHGGMGVVYKARQVGLNRLVALKMILTGAFAAQEELARFRMEAQAAARLDHLNIVRIYDFGEHKRLPYYSMELITGGSLADKTAGSCWPASTAAQLIHTLASALQHAHEHHIIHRDLKPSNVLFHCDGTPRVTDFGLAKQLDSGTDLTDPGRVLGTVRYMAPEQAAGKTRAIGPATDVHALGAILYELLTGAAPFDGEDMLATLEQVRSKAPIPPTHFRSDIPPDLEAVCLRCLRKDPKHRTPSAKVLAEELEALLADPLIAQKSAPPSDSNCSNSNLPNRSEWWRM
jgi:serine/threonine-protein kinase